MRTRYDAENAENAFSSLFSSVSYYNFSCLNIVARVNDTIKETKERIDLAVLYITTTVVVRNYIRHILV